MHPYTILVTGGHVTPAIAVIDEIQKKRPQTKVEFVGRRFNNNTEKSESFEYKEIQKRQIPFHHLQTGKLTRSISLQSIRNILNIPIGFMNSYKVLSSVKPDLVLSFGGYLALPVALVASWLKIPVYTHEQTIHPGIANQRIAKVASKIFVAFPEASKYFPKDKVQVTGNPIRESIFIKKPLDFDISNKIPCIYVTGGSLGAHAINERIEQIIHTLLENYTVIHQTGNVQEYNDYERLVKLRSSLPTHLQSRYILKTHVDDDEIGSIFSHAKLVISRSGANTFFELIALKKPSIVIPLPLAAFDEQRKHARILKEAVVSEIFEQERDPQDLLQMIQTMLSRIEKYEKSFEGLTRTYTNRATQRIIQEIFESPKE